MEAQCHTKLCLHIRVILSMYIFLTLICIKKKYCDYIFDIYILLVYLYRFNLKQSNGKSSEKGFPLILVTSSLEKRYTMIAI